jgi:two-component system phosphate regulon response regulator OmpR
MTETILLIEDDESLSAMLAEYLGSKGLEVRTARDGEEGLVALGRSPCDVVVLDVMLPGFDGFEVLRRLRRQNDVPVLMLTARGEDTDRIVGLELGADDYLAKPFNPRELLARLRALIRRQQRAVTGPRRSLRFGALTIDRERRLVRLSGVEKELTSYQFDLLLALAENAGRVMTRDALMKRLRGVELEPYDRSLDVHISRIRAAVEEDPKHPHRILTIRSVGYLFSSALDDAGERGE